MKRLAFALCLCLLLSGCTPRPVERRVFAMNTVMTLTIYGSNAEAGMTAVAAKLNDLDRLLSVTREESQVWAINHAGGRSIELDGDLYPLLVNAISLGRYTEGALDVTLYPVLREWGFTTDEYQVPSQDRLTELLNYVNYQAIQLDDGTAAPTVTLPQGMELDFGALAKGYAGEVCANLLRGEGVESALLRLGGNIQAVGAKPDGSPWRVGVQDPDGGEEDLLGILDLTDQAAVTSGGYQRYFEEDGVRYWHILDPSTGRPARSGLTSVTVVGDSGLLCDALSTAFFVMGKDKALDYWQNRRSETWTFELVLAGEDKNLWVTAGLADAFTLDPNCGYTLNIVEA